MDNEQYDFVFTRVLLALAALGLVVAASVEDVFWTGFFALTALVVKWWYWTLHIRGH